jgi:hypothetical protein
VEAGSLIQGHVVDSLEEWRVAKALVILEREFYYQFPIGPLGVKGSYIVDFYVEGVPSWIPLEVMSVRWHTGIFTKDEKLRAAIIAQVLHAKVRYIWEGNLQTLGDAIVNLQRVLTEPIKEMF